jgi:hypothetical protein
MPVILASWEAEIRFAVRGQPGKIVEDILSPKQPEQNGLDVCLDDTVPVFTSVKPWVQAPVPQNKQTNKQTTKLWD